MVFAVGIEADSDRVEALIKELEGKDIAEVIAAGVSKLASVPSGGGGVAAASGRETLFSLPWFLHVHSPLCRVFQPQV